MSLETDITSALSGIPGIRVHADVTADKPTFPCVVYQQVGGDVLNPLECVVPDMEHARVQIWIWAKKRDQASEISRQVRVALVETLKAYAYSAPVSNYDDVLKLYGARCDYGIWFTP